MEHGHWPSRQRCAGARIWGAVTKQEREETGLARPCSSAENDRVELRLHIPVFPHGFCKKPTTFPGTYTRLTSGFPQEKKVER